MPDLAVIVPVRDEAASLGAVLDGLRAHLPRAEIVVVDDGSTDESAAVARARGVRVVSHERGRGYGAAVRTGVAATAAPRVGLIDGDGTYDPADLAVLDRLVPPGGMVVGARRGEPAAARRVLKAAASALAERLTGHAVPDLNSGLRIVDRALLARLEPALPDRFSLTTTLTLGALALGAPVRFAPVTYGPRRGRSKFGVLDALRFFRTVLRGCRWIRKGRVTPAAARTVAAGRRGRRADVAAPPVRSAPVER